MSAAKRHDPFPVNPTYAGIYSHGVEWPAASRTLVVSGQVGVAPDGALAKDFDGQFIQAIENMRGVLASARMSDRDIAKMTIYLVNAEDVPKAVAIRKCFFDGVRPAITTVIVAALVSPDWLVEIEVTASHAETALPAVPRGSWV